MVTRTGSRTMVWASSSIFGAMVAEKNRVWRSAGIWDSTRLMSGMKPMSSIRSTSSRMKTSTSSRWMNPCCIRSSSRPGVATRISTPRFRALTWWNWLTPPKITVWLRRRKRP